MGASKALTTWAVIDAARYRGGLYDLVEQHQRSHPRDVLCLFDGQAFHTMGRSGPWLVRVDRDASLFRQWLGAGWGESWGIFLASRETDIAKVKRHLKRIVTAYIRDPDSNTDAAALYRFYDPRVLRSTVPFLGPNALRAVFSDVVECYVVEGVRTAWVAGRPVINEIYRYSLYHEGLLDHVLHTPRLREGTFTFALGSASAQAPEVPAGPHQGPTP